jgi:phenylalanyl-tRNA synthetase alpha chain
MEMDLEKIKEEGLLAISQAQDFLFLEEAERQYLGKKGVIAEFFNGLKDLPTEERRTAGQKANEVKVTLQDAHDKKEAQLKTQERQKIGAEKIDVTMPGQAVELGRLHPLTLVLREAEDIFKSMGFEVAQGPEVETEWYNFDALNIPEWHPARDMWDTFWLKQKNIKNKEKILLRTHTSPVQVRYMERHKPPIRIIAPGKVFRYEATDASHEIQFHQVEGLMVDENISVANFKAIVETFFQRFFDDKNIRVRLRPSYFPFTEPSFEIDVSRGEGKWLELAGAGMVHPKVLEAAGVDSSKWQGFAFGMGLDRLAMIKYRIHDIRLFYQNDLRFLNQF